MRISRLFKFLQKTLNSRFGSTSLTILSLPKDRGNDVGSVVMFLWVIVFLSGCTHTEFNLATQQEETLLYSEEKEARIGQRVAEKIEEEYSVLRDEEINRRVEDVLTRITTVCDRKDLLYRIKVIDRKDPDDDEIVNAVSLPGGYIYLFKDLFDKIKTDDELAGVIAHEVGHITAKHSLKRMQNANGALILQVLAATQTSARTAAGVGLALTSLFFEYAKQDEFAADQLAVKYMKAAGYDPQGAVDLLEILQEHGRRQPVRPFSYWRTHPYVSQRIARVKGDIKGEMEFGDYIHLIGAE